MMPDAMMPKSRLCPLIGMEFAVEHRLYRLTPGEVPAHNRRHLVGVNAAVPNPLRLHQHHRAIAALSQARAAGDCHTGSGVSLKSR